MYRRFPTTFPLLLLHAATAAQAATTAVWDGSNADWIDPSHWSLPTYPDNDHPLGSAYDVQIPGGSVSTPEITIDSLLLHGDLTGQGPLNVQNALTWTAGAIALAGGLTANGAAAIDIPQNTLLSLASSLTLGAAATGTFSAAPTGTLKLLGDGVLINNGTLNAGAGDIAFFGSYATSGHYATVINNGTLNIDAADGAFTLRNGNIAYEATALFENNGHIHIRSGTLNLLTDDTGSTPGSIDIAAGATLTLAGAYTFTSTSSLAGDGNLVIAPAAGLRTQDFLRFDGTFDIRGSVSGTAGIPITFNTAATIHDFTYKPILNGSGSLTLTGTSVLTEPRIALPAFTAAGTVTFSSTNASLLLPTFSGTQAVVNPGGHLVLNGTRFYLLKSTLTNNGTVTVSGAITFMGSSEPRLVNNGTLNIQNNFTASSNTRLDNNGIINITAGVTQISASGTSSADSLVHISGAGSLWLLASHPFLAGTLWNEATLTNSPFASGTITFGAALTFRNAGTFDIKAARVLLAAPQDPASTGLFTVEAPATLEFAANYDFSTAGGPTLTGSGLLIIDPNTTLTLPVDTAFTGTIQVDGQLIIAAPLNPADINMTPNFTILPAAVPEPASLTLLAFAAPLFLRKRRPTPGFTN
jgi:hypothetical protein